MLTDNLPLREAYKKYIIWFVPIIAFISLVLLMQASGNSQTAAPPSDNHPPVVTVSAINWHEQYVQNRLVAGRIEAPQNTAIGFDLAGSVVNIRVDEGQPIKLGQLLAEVDEQRLRAQMSELAASINRAKTDAKLARLSLKRIAELVERKLESAQRLDEARESANAATAFVEEVSARQRTLQVELSKTKLYAPFSGSVVNRWVDVGAVVSAGQPLFNLQQDGPLDARFSMPAQHTKTLVQGQSIALIFNGEETRGVVKSISKQRRLDTRTVDVIISLTDPLPTMLAGDLVQIDISSQVNEKGFWLPRKALVSGVRGLWSLFVVEPLADEHQLVAKLVELIYTDNTRVFVRGALQNNEQVVVEGVHRLVPGQKVQIAKVNKTVANHLNGQL